MRSKLDNISERHGIFQKSRERYKLAISADWRFFDFFRALQISPSYWNFHAGRRDGSPARSSDDQVVSVYERFGQVWDVPFWTWWFEKAQFQFGIQQVAGVNLLGLTQENTRLSTEELGSLSDTVREYCSTDLLEQGLPSNAFLAVPLKGNRKSILAQVNRILDEQAALGRYVEETSPFRMQKNNIRRDTIRMAIRVAHTQAEFKGEPLYVIGRRASIKGYIVNEASKSEQNDDRRELSMITSRHLWRAYHLAENAARGVFPSFDAPPKSTEWPTIDYKALKERLDRYSLVSADALDRIPTEERTSEARYAGRNRSIDYGK